MISARPSQRKQGSSGESVGRVSNAEHEHEHEHEHDLEHENGSEHGHGPEDADELDAAGGQRRLILVSIATMRERSDLAC